ASVNGASTLPFAGHIQSTSSLSVPGEGFSCSGCAGAGATGVPGGVEVTTGGGASPASGDGPDSAAFICESVRSVKGTLFARGSTFDVGVFASGRASIGGPGVASGVVSGEVTGPVAAAAPVGAASTSVRPTSRRFGL